MKKYLIDIDTVSTFWVTASSENEALLALKKTASALELRIQVGGRTPIEFVDLTWRDDEPLMIEEFDN